MIIIDKYFKLCDENKLINNNIISKYNKPKISIITPVYNQETKIKRYLRSIQYQLFKEIEIIIIDDKSTDNSVKIIEDEKLVDKRIILLKNFKRKGSLISKNIGVYKSRSEYILFVDPDDLLSQDILSYLYNLSKEKKYDFIRFHLYTGNGGLNIPGISYYLKNEKIYKPNLFYFLYLGFGKLFQLDFYLTNKIIKRKLLIIVLNTINKYFLEQNMIDCEDGMINFMLYKLSNSYYFTKKIGYYYIVNNSSITFSLSNFSKRLKSNFIYVKYLFENTKNNNIEKKFVDFVFSDIFSNHPDIINLLRNLTYDYKFYLSIINEYLKNDFISLRTKNQLNLFKNIIRKKYYL